MLFSLLFNISLASDATTKCFIKSSPVLLFIENNIFNYKDVVQNSDCPEEIKQQFSTFASQASGILTEQKINHYIQRNNIYINLIPSTVNIKQVVDLLHKDVLNDNSYFLRNLKQLSDNKVLMLTQEHKINLECENCNNTGTKNVKLVISNGTEKRAYWLTLELLRKRIALRAKETISPFTSLSSQNLFEKVEVPLEENVELFTNVEQLMFYQTNKTIKKGQFLTNADLNANILVRAGRKVHVEIIKNKLHLKTIGVSHSSGKINELIEVQNPETRKKYLAKIIDENKVLLEL